MAVRAEKYRQFAENEASEIPDRGPAHLPILFVLAETGRAA